MRHVLALLVGLSLAWPVAAEQGPGCGAPAEWLASPPLRATATGISTGRLRILAVGSASVSGPGVTSPAAAWPVRLEALLRERRPDLELSVEVRGARGTTAADQWRQIEEALRAGPIDLVIWQAGMTEVVRGLPIDDMAAIMGQGLQRLHARGVDAIVMGIQYSRFLRANAEVDPYRDALRVLAAAGHAGFFSRYDIMRAWTEAGTVDMERAQRDRRAAEIDKLNDCLARALGAFIRVGVQEARR
ncbi:SGNH/GDSL hydrolase family protein [Roseomonas rosulenta]|uniref:SGNH/GDSL hydrolase family protein n=1 Tax=Roseomonas rosulenta TaxID=2748667 RepID=UPI0018DF413B|nr:SGNH/GDSL hydrolase family protein [Roseomonas rosulenta]